MAGIEPSATLNPRPLIAIELTVTGDVPDEVSVNVWVEVVFNNTLGKLRLLALTVS